MNQSLTITITDTTSIDGWIEAANRNNTTPEKLMLEFLGWQGKSYSQIFKIGMVTSAAFIRRFSAEEYGIILNAAKQSQEINQLVEELISNPVISLNDPRLIDGLQKLTEIGILGVGRIEELLFYDKPVPETIND